MRNRNEHAAVRRNTDLNTLRLTKKTQVKRKGGEEKDKDRKCNRKQDT